MYFDEVKKSKLSVCQWLFEEHFTLFPDLVAKPRSDEPQLTQNTKSSGAAAFEWV